MNVQPAWAKRHTRAASAGLLLWVVAVCASGASAQEIQFGAASPNTKAAHVVLLTDALEVSAGQAQEAELRFRVEPGFHINSHRPKDELLLPTELTLTSADGVKVRSEAYPAGVAFRLLSPDGSAPGETLDVYQGEFRVKLRLTARKGESTLSGILKYQACDKAACFPPRSLPVRVLVTGK